MQICATYYRPCIYAPPPLAGARIKSLIKFLVCYSATNYLLGATPLQFPAYIAGSLVGLTFWCSIYATLGAAGRELLRGGLGLDVLFDELLSKAGSYTEDAAIIMGVVGICIALYVKFAPQEDSSEDKHDKKEKRT